MKMAYIVRPELSDSDLTDDDLDYVTYDSKPKSVYKEQAPKILTPKEKLNKQKNEFYNAIFGGNLENVRQILSDGLDVDIILQSKWTPLLLTVSTGHVEITEELLNKGANPNSKRDGVTALMMACSCPRETAPYQESLKVVQLLVEKGADVKATNRKRMTALMFAANAGNLPAVKYLLPLCDKSAEDNQRWNALFWAVNNNEVEVFKYLLQKDLDYSKTDVRGNTLLDIAKSNDFTKIVELFPEEENNGITDIVHANILTFEDIFNTNETPAFFLDICEMLCGMKSEAAITNLADKNLTLKKFLCITDEELKNLGIRMPFQRYRILAGIHRFHKYPFHPKSLHVVPQNEIFSNADMAVQILSAVKQIVVMEAGLKYVMSHCDMEDISKEELDALRKNIDTFKKRIRLCSRVTKKLHDKIKIWDSQLAPADLITKESTRYKWPWRKIIFSITIISLVVFKLRK